jgi:squalene synthase HpnC
VPALSATALPPPEQVTRQAAAENFPVALRVLGPRTARDLMAIYGFARLVDDIGDEATGDRLAQLDWVDDRVGEIDRGTALEHPLLRALQETVNARRLPLEPLRSLIEANRRDQVQSRYETFDDLLGYCALSADPVGELVLGVFGLATPERIALSNRICSALQVIEHLQDVSEDYARGRVYLPQEDLRRCGCAEEELGAPMAGAALRRVAALQAERAHALLDAGAPLLTRLPARPRIAVTAFLAGGRSALVALERGGLDVCGGPRRASRAAVVRAFAVAWVRR